MNSSEGNRREHQRAFFTLEEAISAAVVSSNSHGPSGPPVPVTLLSISPGGLSFLGVRYKFPSLKKGDRMVLSEVTLPEPIGKIEKAGIEVKYLLDLENEVRFTAGCEFTALDPDNQQKISDYVRERLKILDVKDDK